MTTSSAPEVFTVLKACGIRQKDLAQKLDTPEAVVSMWARGIKPVPLYRLHDFWALASLARAALAAGQSVQEALSSWYPTRQVQRNSAGQTSLATIYHLPVDRFRLLDLHASNALFQQPGGSTRLALTLISQILQDYLPRVIYNPNYTAADLEQLRQAFEGGLEAIYLLQEGLARQPPSTLTQERVPGEGARETPETEGACPWKPVVG
jgi:hypothetical protein